MFETHRSLSGKAAFPLGPRSTEIGVFDTSIWELASVYWLSCQRLEERTALKYDTEVKVLDFTDTIMGSSSLCVQDLAGAIYDGRCILPEVTLQELSVLLGKLNYSLADIDKIRVAIKCQPTLVYAGNIAKETVGMLRSSVRDLLVGDAGVYAGEVSGKKRSGQQKFVFDRDVWQILAVRKIDLVWGSKGDGYVVVFYTRNEMLARIMPLVFDRQDRVLHAVQYDVGSDFEPYYTYNVSVEQMDRERVWERMLRVKRTQHVSSATL